MLKINLSGKKSPGKPDEVEEPVVEQNEEPTTQAAPDTTAVENIAEAAVGKKKKGFLGTPALVVILIIFLVGAVIYHKMDVIVSLFIGTPEISTPVQPPPPPPPEPEPAAEPDPVFVALDRISVSMTPKVWLTSVIMVNDGTYEIQGIAFTHAAMAGFVSGLGSQGTVGDMTLPKKQASLETVYKFSVKGALGGVVPPEILDVIPTDDLVSLAGPVVDLQQDFGVKFGRFPKAGETFGDRDMPFTLDGSYDGLKQVIGALCPEDGPIRVYRMVVTPDSAGRPYDRVKASFSLRTISSI